MLIVYGHPLVISLKITYVPHSTNNTNITHNLMRLNGINVYSGSK